jgi:hypothetical protein
MYEIWDDFFLCYQAYYLLLTTKNMKMFVSISEYVSNFYIYHIRIYMINLRFIFYESYKFNTKNKKINSNNKFYILCILNQRKRAKIIVK